MEMQLNPPAAQSQILQSLQKLQTLEGSPLEKVIETHISWVFLSRDYAYKIKKGINLGFLDYSTLEKRRECCELEITLNRRTAKELYLEVIPIGGTPEQPRLGEEPAIDYAVKMVRFADNALLSELVAESRLTDSDLTGLAEGVAEFHHQAAIVPTREPYGSPAMVAKPMQENFTLLRQGHRDAAIIDQIERLQEWTESELERQHPLLQERKDKEMIRDCHGDLHLGNIVLYDNALRPFDCLEFNPSLRCIDPISEIAFLVMDLSEHHHPHAANLFLNHYLQQSGDYAGLPLLPLYLLYRAMVRAKVATLNIARQDDPDKKNLSLQEAQRYLNLGLKYIQPREPHLFITHGLSGSGKSTFTFDFMQQTNAIRIRSDVERRRLFKGENRYSSKATLTIYQHLFNLANSLLSSGFRIIIDATFLDSKERAKFTQLSNQCHCPITILDFPQSLPLLRERIKIRSQRSDSTSEADIMVLERQIQCDSPFSADELEITINCTESDSHSIRDRVNATGGLQR